MVAEERYQDEVERASSAHRITRRLPIFIFVCCFSFHEWLVSLSAGSRGYGGSGALRFSSLYAWVCLSSFSVDADDGGAGRRGVFGTHGCSDA